MRKYSIVMTVRVRQGIILQLTVTVGTSPRKHHGPRNFLLTSLPPATVSNIQVRWTDLFHKILNVSRLGIYRSHPPRVRGPTVGFSLLACPYHAIRSNLIQIRFCSVPSALPNPHPLAIRVLENSCLEYSVWYSDRNAESGDRDTSD